VLLDNKKHTISFFKNGRDHGVACFYVMGKLFPVVSLQGNVSVTFLQYPQVNLVYILTFILCRWVDISNTLY